jgi:hypothetical protein
MNRAMMRTQGSFAETAENAIDILPELVYDERIDNAYAPDIS